MQDIMINSNDDFYRADFTSVFKDTKITIDNIGTFIYKIPEYIFLVNLKDMMTEEYDLKLLFIQTVKSLLTGKTHSWFEQAEG